MADAAKYAARVADERAEMQMDAKQQEVVAQRAHEIEQQERELAAADKKQDKANRQEMLITLIKSGVSVLQAKEQVDLVFGAEKPADSD